MRTDVFHGSDKFHATPPRMQILEDLLELVQMDGFNAGDMKVNFKHKIMIFVSLCLTLRSVCCVSADDSGQHVNVDYGVVEMLVKRTEGLEKKIELQATVNEEQKELTEHIKDKLVAVEKELTLLKSRQSLEDDNNVPILNSLPENHRNPTVQSVRRGVRQTEAVAFTAYLDHSLYQLGLDEVIVYSKTILNVGNGYSTNSGIFTCPYDGIYVFNFMVSTLCGTQHVVAKLVVDNVNMVDGTSDAFHQAHEAQGGNYAILSLKQGQNVWVANYRWANQGVTSSDNNRFSTFSGHLLM